MWKNAYFSIYYLNKFTSWTNGFTLFDKDYIHRQYVFDNLHICCIYYKHPLYSVHYPTSYRSKVCARTNAQIYAIEYRQQGFKKDLDSIIGQIIW